MPHTRSEIALHSNLPIWTLILASQTFDSCADRLFDVGVQLYRWQIRRRSFWAFPGNSIEVRDRFFLPCTVRFKG